MSISVDIEKSFGSFTLRAAFEAENETLALLGASGCGKSMTLKCVAGIEKPDRGRIVLDDTVLFDSERGINLSPQERRTGLMFQNYALFPGMTVLQNIRAGARRERDRNRREAAIERVMDSFSLAELASRYPHQLSGGQQQRVALARILVSGPQILLLDEPFSALDSHLRFRLEQELRAVIRGFGKTVLLVSHDRDEVYRMADKIAIMKDGKIEVFGGKKDVFAAPLTKNAAMLTGCKNISRMEKLGDGRVFATDWQLELCTRGGEEKATHIGIRMHDIRMGDGENSVYCSIAEIIENPFSVTFMLKPEGAENAVPIGWETDKTKLSIARQDKIWISLPPDSLLLLEDDDV